MKKTYILPLILISILLNYSYIVDYDFSEAFSWVVLTSVFFNFFYVIISTYVVVQLIKNFQYPPVFPSLLWVILSYFVSYFLDQWITFYLEDINTDDFSFYLAPFLLTFGWLNTVNKYTTRKNT